MFRPEAEEIAMTVRRVALLTAGGLAPCLSSAVGALIERYTQLAPEIEIIARASQESSERKLLRAGASDVISPYKASGRAMARIALSARPPVPRDPTGLATPDPEQPVQAAGRHDG